jgi:hypothetical protein
MDANRPIGWWVKRLDELLEQVVEHALAGAGLTRRHWQVLNQLAAGITDPAALTASLAPFAGSADLDRVLTDLGARGWLAISENGPALSADGRVAHGRLSTEVGGMRRLVTDGFSAEEYQRVVAALERMVGNIERALADGAA